MSEVTPSVPAASAPAVDYLDTTDTVYITTALKAGGETRTPIWSVVVDGIPYIRSAYGGEAKWYRRLQRTGTAAFADGSARYPVAIENVDDEATLTAVDDAYSVKYAGQGSALRSVISEPSRSFTMRVIPES